jgi:hypothetical protein
VHGPALVGFIDSGDSVGLHQLAAMAGPDEGRDPRDALADIIATVEGPLRDGIAVPVRLYRG